MVAEAAKFPPPYSNSATPAVSTNEASSHMVSSSSNPFRDHLMTLLEIPSHLTNRAERNIHFAYEKYKAYLRATQTLSMRISEGTWPGKKPSSTDLIEVFLSKSMWFSHYRPAFSKVSNYPLMVEWLENKDDKPSDLEVWGVAKAAYSLTDLRKFVDNGTLAEKKTKGKMKAKDACLAEEFGKGGKGGPKKKVGTSKKLQK